MTCCLTTSILQIFTSLRSSHLPKDMPIYSLQHVEFSPKPQKNLGETDSFRVFFYEDHMNLTFFFMAFKPSSILTIIFWWKT